MEPRHPTLHHELRHKRIHTHPPVPNAKRSCTQCVLCRVGLYSNEDIIHHLSTREHISAVSQFPKVKLEDILIPESYIEEILAGKRRAAPQIPKKEVVMPPAEPSPNMGKMSAGASRQRHHNRLQLEKDPPPEGTSSLSQTNFQLSDALRELVQKIDTSPIKVSPPFNSRGNFPRRDLEMPQYPEEQAPAPSQPSHKRTSDFPRRDLELFHEQLTPTLPPTSHKPTSNFPSREQFTPILPQPSQKRTPSFNALTQLSPTESHHYSQQAVHAIPLIRQRLGHPFPYTTKIQLPSQKRASHKPSLAPTQKLTKPQGSTQVTTPTQSQPSIQSPEPVMSDDTMEHMIHCKICSIVVPNQFHWEAHVKRSSHLMNLKKMEENKAKEIDEAEAEARRVEESEKAKLEEEMMTELMKMEEEDASFYKEELEKESEGIPLETSGYILPETSNYILPETSTEIATVRPAQTKPVKALAVAELQLKCGYCDITVHERSFWLAHVESKRHQTASELCNKLNMVPFRESPANKHIHIPLFYCNLCSVSALDETQYAAHINGRKHQRNLHVQEMPKTDTFTVTHRWAVPSVPQIGVLPAKVSPPHKGMVKTKPQTEISLAVQKPTAITLLKKVSQPTMSQPIVSQPIPAQSPSTLERQVVAKGQRSTSVTVPTEKFPKQTVTNRKIIKLKRSWRRRGNSETSLLVSNESATLKDTEKSESKSQELSIQQKSQFSFNIEASIPSSTSQQIVRTSASKITPTRRSPILPPSPTEGSHPKQPVRCVSQRQVQTPSQVTNPQTIKPSNFQGDSTKVLRKQPSQLLARSSPGPRERSRPAASPVPPTGVRGNSIPRSNVNPPDELINDQLFSNSHDEPMRWGDYQQPITSEYSSQEELDYHAQIEQMRSEAKLDLWDTGSDPEMDSKLYSGEEVADIQGSESPLESTEAEEEIFPEIEIYPDTPDFEQYHDHDHELSVEKFKAARKKQQQYKEDGIDYESRYDFTSDSPELHVVKTQSSLEVKNEWEYPNSPSSGLKRDHLPTTRVAGLHPACTPPIFRNATSGNHGVPTPLSQTFRNATLQHSIHSSNRPFDNHVFSSPQLFRNVFQQHGLNRAASPLGSIPTRVNAAASPPIFRNALQQHGSQRTTSPSGIFPLLQRNSDSDGTSSHSHSQTQSPSSNSPVPVTIATSDRIIADTTGKPRAIQTIDYHHGQNPFIGRNPFLGCSKHKEYSGIWPNKWNSGTL